jgi:hypothetical protein
VDRSERLAGTARAEAPFFEMGETASVVREGQSFKFHFWRRLELSGSK